MKTTEMTVEQRVIKVIAEILVVKEEQVVAAANLAEGLGADELDLLEIAIGLEDVFGWEIPERDVEKFRTVQDVFDCVTARL